MGAFLCHPQLAHIYPFSSSNMNTGRSVPPPPYFASFWLGGVLLPDRYVPKINDRVEHRKAESPLELANWTKQNPRTLVEIMNLARNSMSGLSQDVVGPQQVLTVNSWSGSCKSTRFFGGTMITGGSLPSSMFVIEPSSIMLFFDVNAYYFQYCAP